MCRRRCEAWVSLPVAGGLGRAWLKGASVRWGEEGKGGGRAKEVSWGGARQAQHCAPLAPSDKGAWEPGGRAGAAPPGTFQNKRPPPAGKFPPLELTQKVDSWERSQETWSGPGLGGWGLQGSGSRLCPQGTPVWGSRKETGAPLARANSEVGSDRAGCWEEVVAGRVLRLEDIRYQER